MEVEQHSAAEALAAHHQSEYDKLQAELMGARQENQSLRRRVEHHLNQANISKALESRTCRRYQKDEECI